jgi:hypothetical protein
MNTFRLLLLTVPVVSALSFGCVPGDQFNEVEELSSPETVQGEDEVTSSASPTQPNAFEVPDSFDNAPMEGMSISADYSGTNQIAYNYSQDATALGAENVIGCNRDTCSSFHSSKRALAAGYNNSVNGDQSVAIGNSNSVNADSDDCIAIGRSNLIYANVFNSAAIGENNTVGEDNGYAFGYSNDVEQYAYFGTALGYNNTVSGQKSVAVGSSCSADNTHTTALGYYAVASGVNATALGYSSRAEGSGSVAIGDIKVTGSNAFGIALDEYSTDPDCQGDNTMCIMGGKVGIGTVNPDAALTVNGRVKAEEIEVVANIADYVFKTEYNLMPLDEVEKFIKKNKHLPGVKSEAEVKSQGGTVSIGASYTLLLEKVEELTLHAIAQQKEIERQSKEIESLRKTLR